jgi:hypothetical protein
MVVILSRATGNEKRRALRSSRGLGGYFLGEASHVVEARGGSQ